MMDFILRVAFQECREVHQMGNGSVANWGIDLLRLRLTNEAHRPRLHRDDERSRGSRELRESGGQCRRGPSAAQG